MCLTSVWCHDGRDSKESEKPCLPLPVTLIWKASLCVCKKELFIFNTDVLLWSKFKEFCRKPVRPQARGRLVGWKIRWKRKHDSRGSLLWFLLWFIRSRVAVRCPSLSPLPNLAPPCLGLHYNFQSTHLTKYHSEATWHSIRMDVYFCLCSTSDDSDALTLVWNVLSKYQL